MRTSTALRLGILFAPEAQKEGIWFKKKKKTQRVRIKSLIRLPQSIALFRRIFFYLGSGRSCLFDKPFSFLRLFFGSWIGVVENNNGQQRHDSSALSAVCSEVRLQKRCLSLFPCNKKFPSGSDAFSATVSPFCTCFSGNRVDIVQIRDTHTRTRAHKKYQRVDPRRSPPPSPNPLSCRCVRRLRSRPEWDT